MAEEFQGKGLMTRAGKKVLTHLFETAGLNRIEVRCDVRNSRSRALAERLGFVYEGTKRQADKIGGEFVDMHYFGLLREEWEARRCR
ncbi:MAG TPA: GNAT family protein [Armatimonadota bacterium]